MQKLNWLKPLWCPTLPWTLATLSLNILQMINYIYFSLAKKSKRDMLWSTVFIVFIYLLVRFINHPSLGGWEEDYTIKPTNKKETTLVKNNIRWYQFEVLSPIKGENKENVKKKRASGRRVVPEDGNCCYLQPNMEYHCLTCLTLGPAGHGLGRVPPSRSQGWKGCGPGQGQLDFFWSMINNIIY